MGRLRCSKRSYLRCCFAIVNCRRRIAFFEWYFQVFFNKAICVSWQVSSLLLNFSQRALSLASSIVSLIIGDHMAMIWSMMLVRKFMLDIGHYDGSSE